MIKKILTITILVYMATLAQVVSLKNRDSVAFNNYTNTDIFPMQKLVNGEYLWRKASYYSLNRNFKESLLNYSNTWTQENTFNANVKTRHITPVANDVYWLGWWTNQRWRYVFAKTGVFEEIIIVPAYQTDSSQGTTIGYDGAEIQFSARFSPIDSAQQSLGKMEKPIDTVYAQSLSNSLDIALIAQANEGLLSPPSIVKRGVLIKPIALHYPQLYPITSSTRSLTIKSEIINLQVNASGGSIDTLYIGSELTATLGVPIVTIYHQSGTDAVTITDTNGAGFNYCIRASSNITLNRYDSITLMFDKNIQQWIVINYYNSD